MGHSQELHCRYSARALVVKELSQQSDMV